MLAFLFSKAHLHYQDPHLNRSGPLVCLVRSPYALLLDIIDDVLSQPQMMSKLPLLRQTQAKSKCLLLLVRLCTENYLKLVKSLDLSLNTECMIFRKRCMY